MRLAMLAVFAAAITSGCDDGNPVAPSDVVAQTWELVSLQRDGSDVVVPDPAKYTLRLEEDGRVGVKSDCNSCGGSYSLSGSDLEFSAIACTKVACQTPTLDPDYALALEGPKTVSLSDSELIIRGNGVTLRFRR
jgi:heat shock protein HslJ